MSLLYEIGKEQGAFRVIKFNNYQIYEQYLEEYRGLELNFLEISDKTSQEFDWYMWQNYFPRKGDFYAVNLSQGKVLRKLPDSIIKFSGEELDMFDLRADSNFFDVIIIQVKETLQLELFQKVWPKLKIGGILFVENIDYKKDKCKKIIDIFAYLRDKKNKFEDNCNIISKDFMDTLKLEVGESIIWWNKNVPSVGILKKIERPLEIKETVKNVKKENEIKTLIQ